MSSPSTQRNIPVLVFLIVATILVYQNSLSNGFVFDDSSVIVENFYIKHPTYIADIFNKNYFDYFGEVSYRPVATLTYFLDHALWGMSPRGYHLTNLCLHIANVVLFFFLLFRLFFRRKSIILAAFLFALHPVMTESVNAVSFREELLAVFFTFSSLWMFLKFREGNQDNDASNVKGYFYLTSSILFLGMGLLSKENVMIYPALLGIVYFHVNGWKFIWPQGRDRLYGILVVIMIGLFACIRFSLFLNDRVVEDVLSDDLAVRGLTGISIVGYYLKLFLFPFPLAADYTFPKSVGIEIIRGLLTVGLISYLSLCIWKSGDFLIRFGWLWFLAALVPTLNIYPIGNPVAERYLYLPSAGAYMLLAGWVSRFSMSDAMVASKIKSLIPKLCLAFILFCFVSLTIHRNFDWRDPDTLWQETAKVTPRSYLVLNNLGISYKGKGELADAVRVFQESIKINPQYARTYANLGLAYHEMGDHDLAVKTLSKGLQLDERNVYLLINLGKVKIDMGQEKEGLELLQRAIDVKPHLAEPYLAMGNLYLRWGQFEQAVRVYQTAGENRPDYPEPWINIGVAYARQGRYTEAVEFLTRAVLIDPEEPTANLNLAMAYYFLNDYEKAGKYAKIAYDRGVELPDVLLRLLFP
ncbi:MAG: tetratricopeptide repeat protein [Nitrospinales bacterium]